MACCRTCPSALSAISRSRFASAMRSRCGCETTLSLMLPPPRAVHRRCEHTRPPVRRHNSFKKRLTSRSFLRVAQRRRLLSRVHRPCLKLPFRAPDGPPEPLAPPCIRQRVRSFTAACRQGEPILGECQQLTRFRQLAVLLLHQIPRIGPSTSLRPTVLTSRSGGHATRRN